MGMERIKSMKERAMYLAEQGLNQDVACINAKELGEVIDIVKDLEEACYYCAIVESMEESKDDNKINEMMDKYIPGYTRNYRPMYDDVHMYSRMYTPSSTSGTSSRRYYEDYSMMPRRNYMPMDDDMTNVHHKMDGESWRYRRNYMEHKESGKDSSKDLEEYAKTLTEDVMDMVNGMSASDKSVLKQKITTLASKIV